MNFFQELILDYLPFNKKINSHGWFTFNCPCCMSQGEKRNDTKHRGNFKITEDGGWVYFCYNCKFSVVWKPENYITNKVKDLLKDIGISENLIQEVSFNLNKIQKENIQLEHHIKPFTSYKKVPLPEGSKKIINLLKENFDNKCFLNVVKYIIDRDKNLFQYYDFYYSLQYPNGVIIPCYYKNEIWGYIVRNIIGEPRYHKNIPEGYLFGVDNIFKNRKNIIITEGTLDAIYLDCVSINSNTISKEQLYWLDVFKEKQKIIVPDRDEAGKKLVEQALQYKWTVSFPNWESGIKDVADACEKYGRLLVLKNIMSNIINDEFKIKLQMKMWF